MNKFYITTERVVFLNTHNICGEYATYYYGDLTSQTKSSKQYMVHCDIIDIVYSTVIPLYITQNPAQIKYTPNT